MKNSIAIFAALAALAALCAGCAHLHDYVISATGTVIGVKIGENPQTDLYEAQLGYARTELALVPTNKNGTNTTSTGGGAKDAPNVIMEVRYGSIFSFSDASIYQRLAVGEVAVQQPGAAFMFLHSPNVPATNTVGKAVTVINTVTGK